MNVKSAVGLMVSSSIFAIVLGAAAPALAQSAAAPPATIPDASPPTTTEAATTALSTSADSSEGGDIIVTAQRREERLQDVPLAITAVSSSLLAKAAVTDLTDLGSVVPGLRITNNNGQLLPRIRGVVSTGTGPGVENSTALYVDGVYLGSSAASLLSLNNIARVEVLKGPQGTLFGRNSTGGLIQVITRTPQATPTAEINLSYGNYETVTANAYLSGGASEALRADLALYYSRQGEGFGRNLFNGNPTYKLNHDFAARSKILFEPSDGTKFTLTGDYSETDNSLNSAGLLRGTAAFPGGPVASYPGRYDTNVNHDAFTIGSQKGASLRWDQKLGDFSLMTLTAYRKSRYDRAFDFDVTPNPVPNPFPTIPYRYFSTSQADRQFSQEVQLLSPSRGAFTWVIGAYYYKARGGFDPVTALFESPFGPYRTPTAVNITGFVSTKSLAGFAQGTLKLSARTNLTAGIRYTDETKSVRGSQFATTVATGLPAPIGPIAVRPAVKIKEPSYRLSIDHHFSDNLMAYASFNRGFKSGGFAAAAPGDAGYQPEKLDAYEVGLKTTLLDGRAHLNAAAFHYIYKDIQIQTVTGAGTVTTNGPAARINGLDVDFDMRFSRAFRLTGGVQLIDDKFTNYPNALIGTAIGGLGQTLGSAKGNRLPLASRTQFTLTPQYTMDLAADSTVDFNVAYSYNSGWYPEADNIIRQNAFSQVNGSIRWTLPRRNFNVMLWGKNLTDVQTFATKATVPGGRHFVIWTPPRTYGVTLGAKF